MSDTSTTPEPAKRRKSSKKAPAEKPASDTAAPVKGQGPTLRVS